MREEDAELGYGQRVQKRCSRRDGGVHERLDDVTPDDCPRCSVAVARVSDDQVMRRAPRGDGRPSATAGAGRGRSIRKRKRTGRVSQT